MVHYCSITNCKNNSVANPNLKFIRLPKDIRGNGWQRLIGLMHLPNDNILRLPNDAIICSAHLADSQNGNISFTMINKSEVPTTMFPQIKQLKEKNVISGANASDLACGTCNKHFQDAEINDVTKCEACSKLHHNSCVKTEAENFDVEEKHWTCENCDKTTNLNFSDPLQVTTEDLQKAEIKFLKDENKVLRDQNTYLQDQVYLMQTLMKQMETNNNLNTKQEIQTNISPTESIEETIDLCNSETAGTNQNENFELEQIKIETTGDYQEDIILEDDMKPRNVIEYEETIIKIENILDQQEEESTLVENKNISCKFHHDAKFCCEFCDIGVKPFKCNTCTSQFAQKASLQAHLETHSEPTFLCEICDQNFTVKAAYMQHVRNHSVDKSRKKNTQTNTCVRKTDSSVRKRNYEQATGKECVCPVCKNQFKSNTGLKIHIKRQHSDKKTYYACEICELKFIAPSILKHHIMIMHTEEKPHGCENM